MFLTISHASQLIITDWMLPEVYQALDRLEQLVELQMGLK